MLLPLAIVNSAAMNIGVHVSFRAMFFSGYMPRGGIAGSYGSYIFSFLRNFHTVLHGDCTNLIPTHKVGGSPFSRLLQIFFVCRLFDDGHSDWHEVIPHSNFDFFFL